MSITILLVSFGVLAVPTLQDYPFRNVSLSWEARVDDLVGRLTLNEIAIQMSKGGAGINGPAPGIPRLGIAPYQWDTECLHGHVGNNATSFPQSIGLAATFSTSIVYKMAEATSQEVRGMHNDHVKKHLRPSGMSCFAPVINIMRDPRWGRNQETYGEDPYQNGMISAAYVKGLQGDHPRYVRASAGCKHFDVYGGPENVPVSRFSFNAKVSMRDWRTTFLPAFRYCVKAGTFSIMCSFNSINGVPACANPYTLTHVLRKEWGFKGYVVSDESAYEMIISEHHYLNNSVDTAAQVVNAGCNLELAWRKTTDEILMHIPDAVKQGKLTESLVRERVKPLFYTRMRLGEFDPPEMNPYASITSGVIEDRAHRDLAIEAAMKTFVLLKNDGVLPLKGSFNNIAVIGPMANNTSLMGGDYNTNTDPKFISTPLESLQVLGHTKYTSGCLDTRCTGYDPAAVKRAVTDVELVFICIGLGILLEEEANDRWDIELPGMQGLMIEDAIKYSGNAQIILLTFNAGPLNITRADQHPRISAIIAAFYPGQAAGEALFRVMSGKYTSQFGRLPNTWYYSAGQVPPITNYTMIERTYRYLTTEPLYPFGYGLTYTRFQYNELNYSSSIQAGSTLHGSAVLSNIGQYTADEVVQVYLWWNNPKVTVPKLQLANFTRVTVSKDSQKTVYFSISPENMAIYYDDSGWVVEEGIVTISVGGQQPGQTRTGGSGFLKGSLNIIGHKNLGYY